jgi:uncharacterized protein (DUF362 family)/Pyruvate/2-oxoacid:ferredoxin oxidoreductase delta subunit
MTEVTRTAQVALVTCRDYDALTVYTAVKRSIDLLGGMQAFVRPGARVLLKPNLVRSMPPERAATTHPAVVTAVARLVIEAGGLPLIADSPGGPYSAGTLKSTYRRTGMEAAAEASGATLNYDTGGTQVPNTGGKVLHRLDVINPLLEVDAVINLPKLKTHNLTVLSMGVKNLFGLVPGALKIGYHSKLVDRQLFCEGLLDLMLFVKPVLTVLDAIVCMEGEGPTGGDPRQIGAIVSGGDPLAIDTVGAALVGVDPLDVVTTRLAVARGLTSGNVEDLSVLGDSLEGLQVRDFRQGIDAPLDPGLIPAPLRFLVRVATPPTINDQPDTGTSRAFRALAQSWIWKQLVARPRATERCIACGFCVKHCPVNAIEIVNGRARMDGAVCIRCYCCHELCPHDAIDLYKPLLGRMVSSK